MDCSQQCTVASIYDQSSENIGYKKMENAIYANKEIKEDLGITAGFLKNKCSLL